MGKKRSKATRVLKWIAIASAGTVVLLYLVLPVSMGIFATIRPAKACGEPPAGFEDLVLTASDGVSLAAWYTPGDNGAAILLLHGSKSNRDAIRPYADMLVKSGFGVLALDLRGHGLSGGQANAFGWECTRDVSAAVEFLLQQPDVETIGALGVSLGGEVLLGAADACPQISAIVSDGASHRCTADYVALTANDSLVRSWTTRVLYWSVGLFTGSSEPDAIVESLGGVPGTDLLLIAAGNSQKEIDYNSLYCGIAGDRAEIWVARDVGHTGAAAAYPDEYARKVTTFYEDSLNLHQVSQ